MKKDVAALSILWLLVIFFFLASLYLPTQKLFATPDFGQSDIWSLNMPAKYFLSESLKQGKLPLWNKDIGGGFPILAEGQIGTFYIINLLLFGLLPFYSAWNLGYVITFLVAGTGAYLCGCKIGLSRLASLFSATLFTFSGVFITHISHYNLLQSLSLIPWLLWLSLFREKGIIWVIAFCVFLSQQIFAGFPQVVLIGLLGGLFIILTNPRQHFRLARIISILWFMGGIMLGFLLASSQLLPQLELVERSVRQHGVSYEQASYFSYPFKHLVTMIRPYALGDPRRGTYPAFSQFAGSIFWENTGYIGVFSLVFVGISLFRWRREPEVRRHILLGVVSLLLMTGKYSPLYFLYAFPPFSFFRVPSRFIILFVWSLAILAGFGLQQLKDFLSKWKSAAFIFFPIGIGILSVGELLGFSWQYNAVVDARKLMEEVPKVVDSLKQTNERYVSLGNEAVWNKFFLKEGWLKADRYLYLRNGLTANSNLMYSLPTLSAYPALLTRRIDALQQVFQSNISISGDIATISATGVKFLRLYNIAKIISPLEIKGPEISVDKNIEPPSPTLPTYQIYKVAKPIPHISFTREATVATTVSDVTKLVWKAPFEPKPPLILEEQPRKTDGSSSLNYSLGIIQDDHQKLSFFIDSDKEGYVVISDSFYPGWAARVDGQVEPILSANINARAVWISQGRHRVDFSYEPWTMKTGLLISAAGYIVVSIIFILGIGRKIISLK